MVYGRSHHSVMSVSHIVYLELVERELKLQKDERRAGKNLFAVEFRVLTFIVS